MSLRSLSVAVSLAARLHKYVTVDAVVVGGRSGGYGKTRWLATRSRLAGTVGGDAVPVDDEVAGNASGSRPRLVAPCRYWSPSRPFLRY